MDTYQALILALIQGITEFLPISSSAHLILLPALTTWPDQGLGFDVALNTATLLAVIIYFRKDVVDLIMGILRSPGRGPGKLGLLIIFGTIPVALAGLFGNGLVEESLRSVKVIAVSSIVWGIALYLVDRRPGGGELKGIGILTTAVVAIAQAIAIIPGTSRSGITITAGLAMGLSRASAARFSFLLAIPVGILAGGYEGLKLVEKGLDTPWVPLAIGFVVAFATAYLTIHFFLKIISRSSMTFFVAYRILLGLGLLVWAFI